MSKVVMWFTTPAMANKITFWGLLVMGVFQVLHLPMVLIVSIWGVLQIISAIRVCGNHFSDWKWMLTDENYRAYRWRRARGLFKHFPTGRYVIFQRGEYFGSATSAVEAHDFAYEHMNSEKHDIFITEANPVKPKVVRTRNVRLR